jgi:predicted RNA-binding Zn-ribbon protein involved in translation (DUF1610 family)
MQFLLSDLPELLNGVGISPNTHRKEERKDLKVKTMPTDKLCPKCGNNEFEEMRKPDGQLGLFFCPKCRWAGDTWTLSMLSLVDRKGLIKGWQN